MPSEDMTKALRKAEKKLAKRKAAAEAEGAGKAENKAVQKAEAALAKLKNEAEAEAAAASPEKPKKEKKKKDKAAKKKTAEEEPTAKRAVVGKKSEEKEDESRAKRAKKADAHAPAHAHAHDSHGEYEEHPAVAAMTAAQVAAAREEDGVEVHGYDGEDVSCAYKPIRSFAQAPMPEDVMATCKTFQKPSGIQSHTWPALLRGRDVVGVAATGSGKTLAFGLPALVHARRSANGGPAQPGRPTVLVMAPTRELAVQTAKVCNEAGQTMQPPVAALCAYGGVSKYDQVRALREGVHVLIATPGRLLDLMEGGAADLSDVSYCVLDEADRMLDMGFEREIKTILASVKKERCVVGMVVVVASAVSASLFYLLLSFICSGVT
jgi:ATP-dependent RNA helicase DBP3